MSKIEVNTITQQCGPTLTVGGGACKSVTVDATTVTLGKSGGTVSLAAGATQSGFGRTGTVDWCTTAKTAPFTGVSGKGYFVNTTSGAITVTLPASPSAGDIISIKDYARTFQTNTLTICRNGSKMDGICSNSFISTEGQSATLIYVDGTKGWTSILDSTTLELGATFITATGGTITTCGNYKIHTFTSDGCFSVCSVGNPAGSDSVSYVVVAGGGGADGGYTGPASAYNYSSGGGGAGGYREGKVSGDPYTASPIAVATGVPVSVTSYPITVGGGGTAGSSNSVLATQGSSSIFSTITSAGGGFGKGGGSIATPSGATGGNGGSGGGGGASGPGDSSGGTGNTPPTSPSQGNDGGAGNYNNSTSGGGGGGATEAGFPGTTSPQSPLFPGSAGGTGGAGATSSINGTPTARAGGGGGGSGYEGNPGVTPGPGGAGGGGAGNFTGGGTNGTTNTGGGGGGTTGWSGPNTGGAGGSGVVIIRYKYQ